MNSEFDVVESADGHAILSSIEILWGLGENCMVVGTHHIIESLSIETHVLV